MLFVHRVAQKLHLGFRTKATPLLFESSWSCTNSTLCSTTLCWSVENRLDALMLCMRSRETVQKKFVRNWL